MRSYQERYSINIWAGSLGNFLIGPFVLPQHLNVPTFLVFLRDILPEFLQEIFLALRNHMWFEHDGAPAYYGNLVHDYLNQAYEGRWIGRGGTD